MIIIPRHYSSINTHEQSLLLYLSFSHYRVILGTQIYFYYSLVKDNSQDAFILIQNIILGWTQNTHQSNVTSSDVMYNSTFELQYFHYNKWWYDTKVASAYSLPHWINPLECLNKAYCPWDNVSS